jgi:predicted DNA-binding transcriptional regulator YafY
VYPEERHQGILLLARSEGRVDVAELAIELDVTPETIRRDLRLCCVGRWADDLSREGGRFRQPMRGRRRRHGVGVVLVVR